MYGHPHGLYFYALNPWWEGKEIATGIRRDAYLKKITTYLTRKQIEVFIGSRRTWRKGSGLVFCLSGIRNKIRSETSVTPTYSPGFAAIHPRNMSGFFTFHQ